MGGGWDRVHGQVTALDKPIFGHRRTKSGCETFVQAFAQAFVQAIGKAHIGPQQGGCVISRGDVVWVRLEPRSGSEQRGTRPAVVVSNDVFNHNARWNSLMAVPCTTSRLQGARPATVVELPRRLTGLREDGFAICHQITTLDRSKFGTKTGALDQATLARIEDGIRLALDFS